MEMSPAKHPSSVVRRPSCVVRRSTFDARRPTFMLLAALALGALSCAYYNTFYNAKTDYNDGVKLLAGKTPNQAKDKFDKAIQKSAAEIKNYPKSRWVDEALYLIGMSYYWEDDYLRAIDKFDNLQAVFPHSKFLDQARFYGALSLINEGQYAKGVEALKDLTTASASYREDADFQLGMTDFKREDYETAITDFQDFSRKYPHSRHLQELREYVAESYFQLGRYTDAANAYCGHRALAAGIRDRVPDDLKVAECQLLAGEPDSALTILHHQTDRFAEFNDRINLLTGKALLAKGRKADAYQTLLKVHTGTDAAEAYFLLGRSHESDTNFSQALVYYDTAQQRDPTSVFARQAAQRRMLIGQMLKGRGATADTAESEFLLAEVYHLNLEEDSEAIPLYQKVADSFPKSPYASKALYAIAWIKARSLKHPDSLLAYQQVVDHYPRTVYAQEARKVLGMPLLPAAQIETLPRPVTKLPSAMTDSLAARARAESLGRVNQQLAAKPDTSAKVQTPRPHHEHEERGDRSAPGRGLPGMPNEPNLPGRNMPGSPRHPSTPSSHGSSTPQTPPDTTHAAPTPATKPDTSSPVAAQTLKPDTTKPVSPMLASADTSKKVASPPVAGAPQNSGAPAAKPETLSPAPAKPVPPPVPAESQPHQPARPITPQAESSQSGAAFLSDSELKPVYFGYDSAGIRPDDTLALLAVLKRLAAEPQVQLQITGGCDPRGTDEYNYELGMRRARAVRDWLVARGAHVARIKLRSVGRRLSLSSTPQQYWTERRCEFAIRQH
jgi:TolA-binding protein/outer membrane protein OmpA-like peptidoglycan-associated protein